VTVDYWVKRALAAEAAAGPRDTRALVVAIGQHIEQVAAEVGYRHPEHLSGSEYPATDVPCLPAVVATQIAEKHILEAEAAAGPRDERLREAAQRLVDAIDAKDDANIWGWSRAVRDAVIADSCFTLGCYLNRPDPLADKDRSAAEYDE
jgi:hypothetical protein